MRGTDRSQLSGAEQTPVVLAHASDLTFREHLADLRLAADQRLDQGRVTRRPAHVGDRRQAAPSRVAPLMWGIHRPRSVDSPTSAVSAPSRQARPAPSRTPPPPPAS